MNTSTAGRLVGLAALSFAVAMVMPDSGSASFMFELPIAVVIGFVLAVLLGNAAARRMELHGAVYRELNKLRRIYHLSKNLAASSSRFRSWFTDLHGFLLNYLGTFSRQDLRRYKESNAAFRQLSYHIYTIPDIVSPKEHILFDDLLQTTATVAESRQKIKELLVSRLSPYVWLTVGTMAACFVVAALSSMGPTFASHISVGAEIAVLLIALNLLWEADALSADLNDWAQRYVNNIAKLEYRREPETKNGAAEKTV